MKKKLKRLIRKYPNDADLGVEVRRMYLKEKEEKEVKRSLLDMGENMLM